MKRTAARAIRTALALGLLCVPAGAAGSRRIVESFPAPREGAVGIVLKAGELEVAGGDGEALTFDLLLRCERPTARCERRLARAEIEARATARSLALEVRGVSKRAARKIDVEGRVEMPRGAALTVEMGAGELRVRGVESDVTVDLGIGEASLELREAGVGSVRLRARIGEAELHGESGSPRTRRPLVVGGRVDWDGGPGRAAIDVKVGIGAVSVDLLRPRRP